MTTQNHFMLTLIAKALNRYLDLDPESKRRLHPLQGKVITIRLLPFDFSFQLLITEQKADLQVGESLLAETKISGTPLQMLNMMMNKDNRHQFFADDIKIEGDAELGQSVVELFDDLNIDWEEYLARMIGDVPAYHTGRLLRGAAKWLNQAKNSFTNNINEYVHEEAEWFPTREALHDFYSEIDNLRMDIDRMDAKIKHIKTTLQNPENEK